ncbi:hypothetical protein [Prauserella endophytica]|uniref:Head-to-tail adaptor n=1 Tax=Prauserella endophytica TaxID=1592324 RepID=A0ABY2S088_9PSEU|nr:hypothetical protein [Prauserella endophytica]PXY20315.1 hypothetical protein BAY59_31235 [Prauserella coralliicola]TKG66917.1 hypothetical protein FCN18_23680 [Prauserella endophytica]
MIWATTADIREYLGEDLPTDYPEAQLQRDIDAAVRTLRGKILRWPPIDETTQRAEDAEVRRDIVAAVGEVVRAKLEQRKTQAALGGLAEIVERGGRVKAGKLEVDGTASGGGAANGVGYGRETLLPWPAVEALASAGLIGGSVATW